jgi:hypothetical protein
MSDELWNRVRDKPEAQGTTVSFVVRGLLEAWVAKTPVRPTDIEEAATEVSSRTWD